MKDTQPYSDDSQSQHENPFLTSNAAIKKKRPSPFRRFLVGFIFFLVFVAASLLIARQYLNQQLSPISSQTQNSEFEVMPGWGAQRVARALEEAGFIRNARIFSLYLRFNDLDTQIGEGLYDLSQSMSLDDIAASLVAGGRPRTQRLVIPEGFRIQDIARTIAATGFGEEASLMNNLLNPDTNLDLPEGSSLEGYLFPASYDVPIHSNADDVLNSMLLRFEQELTPEVEAQLSAEGFSVHDWVTLASMVQSEAANSAEMPIIAGVFRNRLDIGMPLQSDPTVAYGLGKDLPELNFPAGDFDVDHAWNTYRRPSLPFGPISNPGHDALQAVLNPIRQTPDGVDYLYFLHGFDGDTKVFRPNTNLADHNSDVARYLR